MDRTELIDELIAGATVVTANDRLARFLKQEVAERWIGQGKTVWETPKALTLAALLDQHHDALCASGDAAAVRVIEPAEAEALWEKVIEGSIARVLRQEQLLQIRALANLADDARGIVLRHRLLEARDGRASYPVSPDALDAREFKLWHEVFVKRLAELRATDAAALPDLIADAWRRGVVVPPQRVIFAGFDEFTPQGQALIDALRAAGSQVTMPVPFPVPDADAPPPAHATRLVLEDARREIERAAAWAGALLAEGRAKCIGIVVPELQTHRQTVIDALDAVLEPEAMVLGRAAVSAPRYNLSLGRPLSDWPLINDALRLLRCTLHEAEWRDVSGVLRSPFFALEREPAAALELWMRGNLPERFPLDALRPGAEKIGVGYLFFFRHFPEGEMPEKNSVSDPDFLGRRPGSREQRLPSAWAAVAAELLQLAGWPDAGGRGRALDAAERQTLDSWDDALRSLCRMDATLGPLPWSKFLTRLTTLCHDTDFQPRAQSPGAQAPIQVLGYLEGAVLEFDALWVLGMDDESWPPPARPNPLLPVALQKDAITPGSSAAERLVHAQRITARLLAAAPTVIVSSPAHEGDAEHRPSPLITALAEHDAASLPGFIRVEDRFTLDQATERFVDAPVPLAADAPARGGTGLITHQSACPFRAFAQHRLGAKELEQPKDATDAAARGSLVHDVLHRFWDEHKSKAALDALTPAQRHASITHHVVTAIEHAARESPSHWTLRLKALEQERLTARLEEWLSLEQQRAPFTVTETEQWHALAVGGLTLNGRIDRVDTVDGKPVYIDYKTGKVDWRGWLGTRPPDPQLPLYAIAGSDAEAAGVMFAQVRVGEHGFAGVSATEGLAPGVERWPPEKPRGEAVKGALYAAPDWTALQAYWRENLTRLAGEFKAGIATVTPERDACRYCHLQLLCRIDELGTAPDSDDPEKSGSDTYLISGISGGGDR